VVISCGNDGTVRVWDLTTKRLTFDDEIKNAQVARVKNAGGTRLPVTCCSYSPNARHIVCGGEDGSLHFWNVRASGNYPPKPDGLIREAHSGSVTSIVFRLPVEGQSASTVFATRSLDHTIKVGSNHTLCVSG
jgi:WD40 repeat protein